MEVILKRCVRDKGHQNVCIISSLDSLVFKKQNCKRAGRRTGKQDENRNMNFKCEIVTGMKIISYASERRLMRL